MSKPKKYSAMESSVRRLRTIIAAAEVGSRIGSEDELVTRLECSRATVRQVARLLEREGLLMVRRGINGGYFAAQPDAGTIEATVAAYLDALNVDPDDTTLIATALWIGAMRKAALAYNSGYADIIAKQSDHVRKVSDSVSFSHVREVELTLQGAVFDIADSPYMKLIFEVNRSYSRRRLQTLAEDIDTAAGVDFVHEWKAAKLIELQSIASGDPELAAMAGQHGRKVWQSRLMQRHVWQQP